MMNRSSAPSTTTKIASAKIEIQRYESLIRWAFGDSGVGRREAAVACVGDGDERQRGAESKHEDEGLAPHRRWHPTR